MKKAISRIVCADLGPISVHTRVHSMPDRMIQFDSAWREGELLDG